MAKKATLKSKAKPQAPAVERSRISQSDIPNLPLEDALKIAKALWDNFAGKSAAPHQIAMAIDKSPTSSDWRVLTGSSIAYGLTDGGYGAAQISLKDIGKRIVAPTADGDDIVARAEALVQPRILREFFEKYNRAKLPRDEIGQNVLVSLGVPKERAVNTFELLKKSGIFAGVIQQTKTGLFVAMDTPIVTDPSLESEVEPDDASDDADSADRSSASVSSGLQNFPAAKPSQSGGSKQLFVAHGKNQKPLNDLKKILDQFKIPYKVAIDEPNKGRPISGKVAELMNECSAGIFIFTKDEKFFRENTKGEHDEIWRPSENVVYELGAANILWDRKIIIVREDGVNFPSDFSDLGYITFKDGEIASKALEILKELVALELVKFSAT